MSTKQAETQRRYVQRQAEHGRKPRKYFATPEEHEKLAAYLLMMRSR